MGQEYADIAASDTSERCQLERDSRASLFDTQLLRAQGGARGASPRDYFVIVLSADSEIVEVLQAPLFDDGLADKLQIGLRVADLAQSAPKASLADQISKTLKGRQVQSAIAGTGDAQYEFLFIPHGRATVIAVGWDTTLRAAEMDRMERLAYQDDLTKLPNRQFLIEELERCTDLLKIKQGRAAMMCLDVRASDTDGGAPADVGDSVISELAARLTHELRGANDPAVVDLDRYSVAARLDHSHFGILLPSIDRGADAEGVAARIVDALREPVRIGRGEIKVSVYAGIALFPQDGTDARTLIANAWAAMDDARVAQDEPVKLHSGTVRLRALQRQDLESELRIALEKDEFDVAFLPVVDAHSRTVTSIEALFRWPQSSSRPRSIRQVIALAENTGLIMPIGEWVLRRGCEALCAWESAGLGKFRLSVNVSAQ
ncbi:MAG: diguanylate cyclase, partial [Pseudomonadota bacterium]